MDNTRRSPILIIGAARSGTTLVAETILSKHPEVGYWSEPSYVWKLGNAYKRYDVLLPGDATSDIVSRIRNRFGDFLKENGGARLMTKCPANTLRMPFVLKVFPDAQIVHVIRDGRDAAKSAAREWKGGGEAALDSPIMRRAALPSRLAKMLYSEADISRRIKSWRDIVELPAYTRRFWHFLRRHLTNSSHLPWGPRFPGIEAVRATYSLLETAGIQWELCVRSALNVCRRLQQTQYQEIRYEALIKEPRGTVERVLKFLGLDAESALLDELVSDMVSRKVPRWPETLSSKEVADIERHIALTLQELEYPLSEVAMCESW